MSEKYDKWVTHIDELNRIPEGWKLIISDFTIHTCVQKLARAVDERYNLSVSKKDIVICSILKGAVYFTVDLSREMETDHSLYFVEASSYSGQEQSEKVETLSNIVPDKFINKHVLLVDELYDNGKTLHTVKELLLNDKKLKLEEYDITTCVIFHKNKETSYPKPDLVGFRDMPNVWYVGYGLDDNQKKRNLRNLYAVPKVAGLEKTPDDIIFESTEKGKKILQSHRDRIIDSL